MAYFLNVLLDAKSKYQVFDEKYDAGHWNETGAIVGISYILDKLNKENPNLDKFYKNFHN